jgi:hypothetical protein
MKTIKLKELNRQYEFVCNELVQKFSNKQDIEFDGWVGDEIGGTATFISQYFFDLSDIILDLKTKQPKGMILDWQDEYVEFNTSSEEQKYINYKSYIMGLRFKKESNKTDKILNISDTTYCYNCGANEKYTGESLHYWNIIYECSSEIVGIHDNENIYLRKECPNLENNENKRKI